MASLHFNGEYGCNICRSAHDRVITAMVQMRVLWCNINVERSYPCLEMMFKWFGMMVEWCTLKNRFRCFDGFLAQKKCAGSHISSSLNKNWLRNQITRTTPLVFLIWRRLELNLSRTQLLVFGADIWQLLREVRDMENPFGKTLFGPHLTFFRAKELYLLIPWCFCCSWLALVWSF